MRADGVVGGGRAVAGEAGSSGCSTGKLVSPEQRRCAVEQAREEYGLSERQACRLLGQWRATQRYAPIQRTDEDALTRAIVALATKYGRYGYRRITALLQGAGWQVGKDRVQRIWRREGHPRLINPTIFLLGQTPDRPTSSFVPAFPEAARHPGNRVTAGFWASSGVISPMRTNWFWSCGTVPAVKRVGEFWPLMKIVPETPCA